MKQTKGAIGNLLNRYRAVLRKCALLNTFGSLVVAGALTVATGGAFAAGDEWVDKPTDPSTITITPGTFGRPQGGVLSNEKIVVDGSNTTSAGATPMAVYSTVGDEFINQGSIWVVADESQGKQARAQGMGAYGGTIINEGNIYVDKVTDNPDEWPTQGADRFHGMGVESGTAINRGLIYVKNGSGIADNTHTASQEGKTILNDEGGRIIAESADAVGIFLRTNEPASTKAQNLGLIDARNGATGVLISATDTGSGTKNFTNDGTITSDADSIGIRVYSEDNDERDLLPNVTIDNNNLIDADGTAISVEQYDGTTKINLNNGSTVNGDISVKTQIGTVTTTVNDYATLNGNYTQSGTKAKLDVTENSTLNLNGILTINGGSANFGKNSTFMVDASKMTDTSSVFTLGNGTSMTVANTAKLVINNAVNGEEYKVVTNNNATRTPEWDYVRSGTDLIRMDKTGDSTYTAKTNDATQAFTGLSSDIASQVNAITEVKGDRAYNSEYAGVRFLARATENNTSRFLGNDKAAAVSTIESAARIAFAGAVPQMTKMASDSATNAVVNRMGFANPENGAKAMNVDGKLVDDKALGLALWIAPLWSNQTGFGMEAGNLDYGYNANIGGVSLGADYTWANNFRAGLMFNIGGGYAESSGDLSETTNSMTFWGVGAYGGWKYENFAIMGDVSYTSTWNSVDQDLDHRMQMGDLEADIQASAISAGLRFEYKLETQYLDFIPHVGARYMSINTWGYDVDSADGTILESDGFQQNIWTFPVGITFSKELEMNNDWYFKPSVDFTVIPAAGDIKAKEDVRFTGPWAYSSELETQMMDYFTWQGGVGLEFGNDNMSVGVNYTLQAGQNSTGHGVFGMFRYEF